MQKVTRVLAGMSNKAAVAGSLAVMSLPVLAQTAGGDYGAAAAITSAQGTALTIIGGFITMGIAVWGGTYILRRFFPKGK